MAARKVTFHDAANREVHEAAGWYAQRSDFSALAFLDSLDQAIARISEAPNRWPIHEKNTRKYVLPRFPFAIYYRVDDNGIEVVAVAHTSRRPGYWENR